MQDSLSKLITSRSHVGTSDPRSTPGSSTTGIFLSLYLILLGFFIVLTAVSEPSSDKSKTVLNSVNGTFNEIITSELGQLNNDKPFPLLSDDEFLLAVDQTLSSELSIKGIMSEYKGNMLEVSIAVDDFFEKGALSLSFDARAIIAKLTAPLKMDTAGRKTLTVLFTTGTNDLDLTASRRDEFLIMRASSLYETLDQLGLQPGQFSTGLISGPEGQIRLVYRHRKRAGLGFISLGENR